MKGGDRIEKDERWMVAYGRRYSVALSGPAVDQPSRLRTPPGVGPPLQTPGRPGQRHPKARQSNYSTNRKNPSTCRRMENEQARKEHLDTSLLRPCSQSARGIPSL